MHTIRWAQVSCGVLLMPLLFSLLAGCDPGTRDRMEQVKPVEHWKHLSSATGDIEPPGPSNRQTASLIADFINDGLHDFVIASRNVGPAGLPYRRTDGGCIRSVIDPAALRIEAGGDVLDIDADRDAGIPGKPYTWATTRLDVWFNNGESVR